MTRESTQKGRFRCVVESLRLVVILLLMMVVGTSEMWGQVTNGLYYIASRDYSANKTTTNFYLCPSEPNETWPYYYSSSSPYFTATNTEMPFMTTFQCRNGEYDSKKALWVLKESSTEGWYYIIHLTDGKYLTYNDAMGNESNAGRMRLHIQATADGDKALFKINYQSANGFYDVISKYAEDHVDTDTRKYLNITGASGKSGNIASLVATNARADGPKVNNKAINVGGLVGLWTYGCSGSNSDSNSRWFPERIQTAPTISDVSATNTITITDAIGLPDGYTIRYTTGDGSQAAPTATTGTEYTGPIEVEDNWTVKAVVVQYGVVLTEVAEKEVTPVIAAPVVTNNGDGTISLSTTTPGGKIYYTTNGDTPDNTKTPYSSAFSLGDATVIKAITYNSTETLSSEVTTYNVPQYVAPTISYNNATSKVTITSEGSVYYNTGDGSQADPTTSSTPYSAPFDVTSPTTVKAIATHVGYFTSEVATLAITQVATPTITVSSGNSVVITCSTEGASIFYTINGSDPGTGSTPYTEPFNVDNGTTIQAIAIKENCINSAIASLTVLSPIEISYDAANNKVVITNAPAGSTIYYTTGTTEADTPDPSGSERIEYIYGNTGFDLLDNVDYIRAIAIKGSDMTSEVNLAIVVHASTSGNDRPYYIQSVECTDFYMIPGDGTNVNTTSLPSAAMQWCFVSAGKEGDVDYYYIKNNATNYYIYYNSSNSSIRLQTATTFNNANATNKNFYKFSIHYENAATKPGYYIHPKNNATATNGLWKNNGNNNPNVLGVSNATATNDNGIRSRWNLIRSTAETKPTVATPFVAWGAGGQYKYYKIKKDNSNFVAPRREGVSYAIPSGSEADNLLWYFDEADHTDWVTYYYIVNAATGEYLYFGGSDQTSDNNNAFIAKQTLGTDAERYQFAFVKTTVNNQYYILPRVLQNLKKNSYSLVYWDGYGTLSTKEDRADAKAKWSFVVSNVTKLCPPILTLDADGKVNMTSRTKDAVMSYKVGDAADYTTFSSNPIGSLSTGSQTTITTKTTIGGVNTEKAITVIYEPTIEFEEGQSFVYNGQTHTPVLNSVKIGETEIKDLCVVSGSDIDAGEATAIVTQKEDDSDNVIWGTKAFTIDQSPLTIYADSKTIEYGDEIGELSFSTFGLATIDDVEVNLSCASGTEMGVYPITFSDLANTNPAAKFTIKRHAGGADASSNYKDIKLIASSLTITAKSLGDGVQKADGITTELTANGEDITVTVGSSPLVKETDFGVVESIEGYYDDKIWTISGIGHYTGSAQVARVKSAFSERDSEWRAGYVASHDWAIPEGSNIEAWIATNVYPSVNVVQVKKVEYLPAGVPAIITANADKSTGVLVSPKSDDTVELTESQKTVNKFKVATEKTDVGDGVYLFHNGEFVLAISGKMPKGSIYLEKQSGSNSGAPMRIVKSDVTGIVEINEDNNIRLYNATWYSLDGRKLSGKPAKKGVYINNGRKIFVK